MFHELIEEGHLLNRQRQNRLKSAAAAIDHLPYPVGRLVRPKEISAHNRGELVFQLALIISHIVSLYSPPVLAIHRAVNHETQPQLRPIEIATLKQLMGVEQIKLEPRA